MTKGITLIAIGDKVYGKWAYNMALFCRYHSPNIPIQLIYSSSALKQLQGWQRGKKFFNIMTEAKAEHYIEDGFCPAKLKMNMYEYLAFDETMYLDVDGYVCQPLEPLFDMCINDYYTSVHGHATKDQNGFKEMLWAGKDLIWSKYSLPADTLLPATNSSFQFIRKGKPCEKLFNYIQNAFSNKIPTKELDLTWGNNQPDELYLNIALAQLKMMPRMTPEPVAYRTNKALNVKEDHKKHFVVSCFGIRGYTHSSVYTQYDRELQQASKKVVGHSREFKVKALVMPKFIHTS